MISEIDIADRVEYYTYYNIRDAWEFKEINYETGLNSEFLLTTSFPSFPAEDLVAFLEPLNYIHLINFHRGISLSRSRKMCKSPEMSEAYIKGNLTQLEVGDIFFLEYHPEFKPRAIIKAECNNNASHFDSADFVFDGADIQLGRAIIDRNNVKYYSFHGDYVPPERGDLCILQTAEI